MRGNVRITPELSTWILVVALSGASFGQSTDRASVDSSGAQGNGASITTPEVRQQISSDGRFVAFYSFASNLVPGDTNDVTDVFVHDRQTGATGRVSIATDGTQGDQDS